MIKNFFLNTLPRYGQLVLFGGSGIAFLQSIKDNRIKELYLKKIRRSKIITRKSRRIRKSKKIFY